MAGGCGETRNPLSNSEAAALSAASTGEHQQCIYLQCLSRRVLGGRRLGQGLHALLSVLHLEGRDCRPLLWHTERQRPGPCKIEARLMIDIARYQSHTNEVNHRPVQGWRLYPFKT